MRHLKHRYRLGRTQSHRKAMVRSLTVSLFRHERIMTTLARAKATRPVAEKLVTLAKKPYTLVRFRRLLDALQHEGMAHKLMKDIAPRFRDRPGGYTRILRLGGDRFVEKGSGKWAANQLGDNGVRVLFELVERQKKEAPLKPVQKKK